MNVLIDSDVILDFLLGREPFSKYSSTVLTKCANKKLSGFVTPIIINNVFYILRKHSTDKIVREHLKALLTFIDILITDKEDILNALNSDFKDFEDALQNYSAISNGSIDVILTRNIKDYKLSTINVLTPETFVKSNLI